MWELIGTVGLATIGGVIAVFSRLNKLEAGMDHLELRIDHLELRMDHLEVKLNDLQKEMTKGFETINLTLAEINLWLI